LAQGITTICVLFHQSPKKETMQRLSALVFAVAACQAASVRLAKPDSKTYDMFASLLRTEPASAAVAAVLTSDEPWKAILQSAISNLALPDALVASASVVADPMAAVAQAASEQATGAKKKMPVNHQIAKEEMDRFIGTLSTDCGGRFKQMLLGKGGDLHTFGSQSVEANAKSCSKLDGTMCATNAKIIKDKKFSTRKRTMSSIMAMSGNSCLPKQCMTSTDLQYMGKFMQTQAKAIIPGDEHRVELHLDCTEHGGPTAVIGAPKSASAFMAPTAVVLMAAIMSTL